MQIVQNRTKVCQDKREEVHHSQWQHREAELREEEDHQEVVDPQAVEEAVEVVEVHQQDH
jgi:hypothetical protein